MDTYLMKKSFCGFLKYEEKEVPFVFENNFVKLLIKDKFMPFGDSAKIPKFMYGTTEDNRDIVFMTNEKAQAGFHIAGFFTPLYIVAHANLKSTDLSKFNILSFVGKTINKVYNPKIAFEPENQEISDFKAIYCGVSELKTKPFKEITKEKNINMFGQNIKFLYSVNHILKTGDCSDNKLGEVNSCINIEIENMQKIENLVKFYIPIVNIIQFMTLQMNIDFEKISIGTKNKDEELYFSLGNCFIYKNYKNIVDKRSDELMSLDDIYENLQEIVDIFVEKDFSLSYLPDSNEEIGEVDVDVLKNVCTALEYEYKHSKIKLKKDKFLNPLVEKIKLEINEFKDNNKENFSNKLYDYLLSNMKHWQLPLSEKIYALYLENQSSMKNICFGNYARREIKINPETIEKFATLRNNTTHGTKFKIEQTDANFCYLMMALVYSSLLKRAGVNQSKIEKIINKIF